MKKQLCLVGPFILCFRTRSAGFVKRFQSESNQRVVSGQGNQGAPPLAPPGLWNHSLRAGPQVHVLADTQVLLLLLLLLRNREATASTVTLPSVTSSGH